MVALTDLSTLLSLKTVNVTLLGKGVFASLIKDLAMKSPWIIQMAPKSSGKDLEKSTGHLE